MSSHTKGCDCGGRGKLFGFPVKLCDAAQPSHDLSATERSTAMFHAMFNGASVPQVLSRSALALLVLPFAIPFAAYLLDLMI